jgi:hypothetical protein
MTGTRMGNTPVWAKKVFTILNSALITIPAIAPTVSPLVHPTGFTNQDFAILSAARTGRRCPERRPRPWREPSTEFSLVH